MKAALGLSLGLLCVLEVHALGLRDGGWSASSRSKAGKDADSRSLRNADDASAADASPCSNDSQCGYPETHVHDLRTRQVGVPPQGPSTDRVPRPPLGSVPYGTTIDSCRPGTMALTFDDGPGIYTSRLLDILDEMNVKATFFIIGNGNGGRAPIDDDSSDSPQLLRRMQAAGHQMRSHTWSHPSMDGVPPDRFNSEITYNEMAFRNLFGTFPTYFRPPYLDCGSSCQASMGNYGYHVISTNCDTKDYENDDPALIGNSRELFSNNVARDPRGQGYIVLAHDVHAQTVANLTVYMINEARSRGYELMTVGDCLGDPRENWYRKA